MNNITGRTFLRPKSIDLCAYLMLFAAVALLFLALATGKMILLSQVGLLTILGSIFVATKDTPVLSFEEEHFEYKGAPLAAKQFIRYTNISGIDIDNKKAIISFDNRRPLKLKLKTIRDEERDDFIATLNSLSTEI